MEQPRHALIDALTGKEVDDPKPLPPPDVPKPKARIEPILPSLRAEYAEGTPIQKEQAWHRAVAYMMAAGHSNKEIAEHFNKSRATIVNLKRQEWFRDLLVKLVDLHFDSDIIGLLQNSAFDAISTLNDLATGAESESVRRSAASDLLDKFLKNKPVETVPEVSDPKEELDRVDAEIKQLESQESS